MREAGLRTEDEPREERDDRDCHHDGDEPFRHPVGEPLDGSTAALRLGDELHDSRQQSFAAYALSAHHERSGAIDGCADDSAVWRFFDGHGFAGDHRLVNRAAAFEQNAVDWNFLARAHA